MNPSSSARHRMCFINLNNHTRFRVSSRRSANSHLSMCSSGLRPESAPAAGHDRAWCHQAGGNPPSRRETPPPWAAVPNEVSSTPPRRHRRLHQWGKRTVQQQLLQKMRLLCCMVKSNPSERSWNERISAAPKSLNFIFKLNDFLIINLYLNKQFGSYDFASSSCAQPCLGSKKKL